jgi:hypothetical protein
MDHAEARERLAAAAEAGRRGDPAAGADPELAAHLAGCPSCAADADGWRRAVEALTEAFATTEPDVAVPGAGERGHAKPDRLPPELRARTLALVAARGRARGLVPAPVALAPTPRTRWRRPVLRALALVASLAILVGGGGLVVDLAHQRDDARTEARQMAWVTASLGSILREPGHLEVTLLRRETSVPAGTVAWGPVSGQLAVVSDQLSAPPPGQTYRCWIAVGGTRTEIGRMEFGDGVAYWVGPIGEARVPAGATFGVSLVSGSSPSPSEPPVLLGTF